MLKAILRISKIKNKTTKGIYNYIVLLYSRLSVLMMECFSFVWLLCNKSSYIVNSMILRLELKFIYEAFHLVSYALVAQLVEHSAVNSHLYDQ